MKLILYTPLLFSLIIGQSQSLVMTLYKDGFALIKQPVSWSVSPGQSYISYQDLPRGIFPDSPFLHLSNATVVSQKLNTAVFDGEQYLNRFLNKNVKVKLVDSKMKTGLLYEVTGGSITLRIGKDTWLIPRSRIEYIVANEQDYVPQFSPELSWEIQTQKEGKIVGELIYLASGFSWNAVYRLLIKDKNQEATFIAEASINNQSEKEYHQVNLQLVEGFLQRTQKPVPFGRPNRTMKNTVAQDFSTYANLPQREDLGDFHIYSLPHSYSFRPSEKLMVRLYEPRDIQFKKTYIFKNSERVQRDEPLSIEIKIENTEENSLNIPLPQGKVELYQISSKNEIEFVGEDILKQIPKGGTATLHGGRAFNVIGKRRILNYNRERKSEEASIEITINNAGETQIEVWAVETITGDWVIKNESSTYFKENATTIYFPLTLAPGALQTITYTYKKQW